MSDFEHKKSKPQFKRLSWSQKNGFNFELIEPDTIRLNLADAIFLLAHLKSEFPQEDLDKKFTEEEQVIIYRYEVFKGKSLKDNFSECIKINSALKVYNRLKTEVDMGMRYLLEPTSVYVEEYLKLFSPEENNDYTKDEKNILDWLDEGRTDEYAFKHILETRTSPYPRKEVINKLKAVFPDIDLAPQIDSLINEAINKEQLTQELIDEQFDNFLVGYPSPQAIKRIKCRCPHIKIEKELDRILRLSVKREFSKNHICNILNEWPTKPSKKIFSMLEDHYGKFNFMSN